MRKILIFLCFLLLSNEMHANVISEKTKNLEENKRIQEQVNKKLEDLANDILSGEKSLKRLSAQIETLNSQTLRLEARAKTQNKDLNLPTSQNADLLKNKANMEDELIALMVRDLACDLPTPRGHVESKENFMASEVLGGLDKILQDEIFELSKDYEDISKLIDDEQEQIKKINEDLKDYDTQLAKLQNLRQKQVSEIKKQKTDRAIYAKKLENSQDQQDELRETLNQLKIIESKQEDKKQSQRTASDNKIVNNTQRVRQIGSSHQGSSAKRYTGKKTIAPLESFTIKQRFGNYIDPVYNIKTFNESVVLRSNKADVVVKSVLNGGIVFAKDTSMLARVVIVEHDNGIHTIYTHLDKIAPDIKVSKNVKRGAVVGRVKNDLTSKVTQKNFYINPLEPISLN